MKKQFDYLDVILISIALISLTFIGTYFYFDKPMQRTLINEMNKVDNVTMCENKSLEKTTECLVDYVKTFYNYTIRNDTEKTIEDIKVNGGDCYDWSKNVYEPLAKQLGFSVDTKRIEGEDVAHRFTIIWDKDLSGYCIIEQKSYRCFELQ